MRAESALGAMFVKVSGTALNSSMQPPAPPAASPRPMQLTDVLALMRDMAGKFVGVAVLVPRINRVKLFEVLLARQSVPSDGEMIRVRLEIWILFAKLILPSLRMRMRWQYQLREQY